MAKKKTNTDSKRKHSQSDKRVLKKQKYKSFKLAKPIKYSGYRIPSSWRLLKMSASFLWKYKKILGGILAIYGVVQFVLVQGVLASDFSELKQEVDESIGGVGSGITLVSYLIGSLGQTNSAESSLYQTILLVIGSLALIWAIRQLMADKSIRIRDAYYKGMYPLIPFILVLLVIGLQIIPAAIGGWLYTVVVSNGIAVSIVEHAFWILIFFIFALMSFYMICSSLFALYIVTLPDMTPLKALRSARGLVLHRRWAVARKLVILLLIFLVSTIVVLLPLIMLAPNLAPITFYIGTIVAMGFGQVYVYSLYRELLRNE